MNADAHKYTDPLPGDLVFSRKPTAFGKSIRWITTNRRERRRREKTLANHVMAVKSGTELVHAVWPRVKAEDIQAVLTGIEAKGGQWCVQRPATPLTPAQDAAVTTFLDASIGLRYSIPEIVLAVPDGLMSKAFGADVICCRKLGNILPWVVCSGLAARLMISLEKLPELMQYADPDMLLDWLTGSQEFVLHKHSPRWGPRAPAPA